MISILGVDSKILVKLAPVKDLFVEQFVEIIQKNIVSEFVTVDDVAIFRQYIFETNLVNMESRC